MTRVRSNRAMERTIGRAGDRLSSDTQFSRSTDARFIARERSTPCVPSGTTSFSAERGWRRLSTPALGASNASDP